MRFRAFECNKDKSSLLIVWSPDYITQYLQHYHIKKLCSRSKPHTHFQCMIQINLSSFSLKHTQGKQSRRYINIKITISHFNGCRNCLKMHIIFCARRERETIEIMIYGLPHRWKNYFMNWKKKQRKKERKSVVRYEFICHFVRKLRLAPVYAIL